MEDQSPVLQLGGQSHITFGSATALHTKYTSRDCQSLGASVIPNPDSLRILINIKLDYLYIERVHVK